MFNPHSDEAPINPLPWTVILLVGIIAAIEITFQLASNGLIGGKEAIGWRLSFGRQFGFIEEVWDWMVINRQFPFEHLQRNLTYMFLHQSLVPTIFVCVFISAIGKFVGDRTSALLVLIVFVLSGLFGAISYASFLNDRSLLLGGFPGVFGLIGAMTWLLFAEKRALGETGISAFRLIIFFMIIQFVWKFFYGGNNQWFAELSGFATGFVICIFFNEEGRLRFHELLQKSRSRGS